MQQLNLEDRRLSIQVRHRPLDYADPLDYFARVGWNSRSALLLESAEIDSKRHLQSFLVADVALRLICRGRQVTAEAQTPLGTQLLKVLAESFQSNPLAGVRVEISAKGVTWHFSQVDQVLTEDERLQAPFVLEPLRRIRGCLQLNAEDAQAVFLGGLLAYDLVELFEPLPDTGDVPVCPDYLFCLAERMIRFDHLQRTATAIELGVAGANGAPPNWGSPLESWRAVDGVAAQGSQPVPIRDNSVALPEPVVDISDEDFGQIVRRLKQEIFQGVVFQAVPSRSFSCPCPDPIAAYRRLRQSNPSPYMFFLQDEAFTLFGASPETAVKFTAEDRMVELCPIAGTRPRGFSPEGRIDLDLDSRIELELRTDQKEMSEHLMLVDLARNDLARICEPGTRHVSQLLRVDRYSHVMHLVSRVKGQLRKGLDALHAYQACMNMGTLSGAPKVQAMQLIRELEGKRRGAYGGAVGYLNGAGDFDSCIVIRSAFVQGGIARVQAGAGVVHDSDPWAEAQETRNKAQAVLGALRPPTLPTAGETPD